MSQLRIAKVSRPKNFAQAHQWAAGSQQRRLGRIGYSQAYRVAASERGLDGGCQVMDVDGDLGHAGARQHPQRIVNQRTPADLDDRFGHGRCKRHQPLALARR